MALADVGKITALLLTLESLAAKPSIAGITGRLHCCCASGVGLTAVKKPCHTMFVIRKNGKRERMLDFSYEQLPSRVVFGIGKLDELESEVVRLGTERARCYAHRNRPRRPKPPRSGWVAVPPVSMPKP